MTNSNELRRKIRELAGLDNNENYWFTRYEMKKIIMKIKPSGKWISDDPNKKTFTTVEDLFPKYLKNIWIEQDTVNTHPNHANLLAIYQNMVNSNIDERYVTRKQGIEEKGVKDSILKSVPNSLLERAKEILITQDNITISIKL